MEHRYKRSWTLLVHAAGRLRDSCLDMSGAEIEKLTIAQERVLQVVHQHSPQGVMLKDIARKVGLTPGAVSQIIEALVKSDLVERTSDANDRRAVNIRITEKSESLRRRIVEFFDSEMETILGQESPEDCETFIAILEKIVGDAPCCSESVRRYAGDTLLAMEEHL